MSLINDALKRAQEEKNRTASPGMDLADPAPPEMCVELVCERPARKKANPMVVVLLLAAVAAGGAWYFLCMKKGPASAVAMSSPLPPAKAPGLVATPRPATVTPAPVDNAPAVQPATTTIDATIAPDDTPETVVDVTNILRPPSVPANFKPRFGNTTTTGNDLLTKLTKPAQNLNPQNPLMPPVQPPSSGFTTNPDWLTSGEPASEVAEPEKPAAAPKTAAKEPPAPETQPATKPALDPAVVAQQFRVTCIMFSDRGSTAIVNGVPAKAGQTVRAEGATQTGAPEGATIKKIDRTCVEIEFSGERFFLRM